MVLQIKKLDYSCQKENEKKGIGLSLEQRLHKIHSEKTNSSFGKQRMSQPFSEFRMLN